MQVELSHSCVDCVSEPARTISRTLRRRRWIMGAALSAMTVVTLDVAVGVFFCRDGQFRQWRLPPYPLLFTENQAKWLAEDDWPYYRFDAALGWVTKPNAVFGEGRYRTNSAAIRSDREYEPIAPAGVRRIAVFGDSFIHGDEVANSETAWAMLESVDPAVEVLNFGVPGYGTDQSYLRYLHDGARYRPHVVVVGLMLENIQRNVSVFRPAYYHDTGLPLAKPRFRLDAGGELELVPCPASSLAELRELIDSRRLVDRLCETDYWVRRCQAAYRGSPWLASSLARIAYAGYANRGRSHLDFYADPASEPFVVTAEVLTAFCQRALGDGAERAVVLILPDKNTVRDQIVTPQQEPYWQSMVDALRTRGVECVDFSAALFEKARHDGIDACFVGTHFSPRGHEELSRFLERELFR